MSRNVSPRDIVRFQYLRAVRSCDVRCFCMLRAMAIPIEPRPIHPRRGTFDVDIFIDMQHGTQVFDCILPALIM